MLALVEVEQVAHSEVLEGGLFDEVDLLDVLEIVVEDDVVLLGEEAGESPLEVVVEAEVVLDVE